ncbi:MAG: AraC family transcriptional regulator [Spirochaetales bacterium]|nr:AraC family transcriptional regulator [Spirochaetales bacterium]
MPTQYWVERINRTINRVRMEPERRWSVEDVARKADASTFHFHRIFAAVTGETVAAFVRRVRLEHAAYLLKSGTSRSITSVAMQMGFASSAEFSREFRREYGVAPSRWDRTSRVDRIPKVNADTPQSEPAIANVISVTACRVAFVRMKTWFEIPVLQRGYERLTDSLEADGFDWRSARLVGMSWDNYETTPLELVTYDLGFVVPASFESHRGLTAIDLPVHDAVTIRCSGELRVVADAWDFLYERWLPEHEREPNHLPTMKWFVRRPDQIGWDRWEVDCAIPLAVAVRTTTA